ncbi:hypothetical protein KC19_10G037000 [Ceratodon purpureus]|uniref:Uncharacterized protein n=1 Tax=Ceratodon purpureus TaxID=3225 RepID=A0A8T0GHQ3_CERPU|nr:hypothetical protein KC19_10G037000 [Ceratodon purpureus]
MYVYDRLQVYDLCVRGREDLLWTFLDRPRTVHRSSGVFVNSSLQCTSLPGNFADNLESTLGLDSCGRSLC